MNYKGIVTEVDNIKRTAKVTLKDLNNVTSPMIPYAKHISSLAINDLVSVVLFNNNLSDAVILGSF